MGKQDIDSSINLPFQHVKESFKVRGPSFSSERLNGADFQAGTLTTPSIVATCLEEFPELSKDGVDEEAIRGMSGTVYLGEHHYHTTIKNYIRRARRGSRR